MVIKASFKNTLGPTAAKHPIQLISHGKTRTDNYAWIRAENWQEVLQNPNCLSPEIRAYLEAENAYTDQLMSDTDALQKTLTSEMRGRIKEDDSSVPMRDGPFAYGYAYREGGEHPRYFRTPREGGEEEVLIDGDIQAQGLPYFQLSSAEASPDHSLLLWGYDDKGSEFYTLRIRDLATKKDLPDTIEGTGGSGVFNSDGTGFWYVRLDENHRPTTLLYHEIGQPTSQDRIIFENTDPGYFMGLGDSPLNDWIFITLNDHETSEYLILPANNSQAQPTLVEPRRDGILYDLEPAGEEFFILTNDSGADDFKIMATSVTSLGKENWHEVVAHEPGRLILDIQAYQNYLVRLERKDGTPRIIIRERITGLEHAIAFKEEAYSLGLIGSLEYNTNIIRFSYSSMTTPEQVFDYNMLTRERVLLKRQEVPSGHDPENYISRRLMAPAPDGELVPISLVYHKDTPLDGSAPCLLYGYGSYGVTIPASFRTNLLSLVDRGFIYAIAHTRGGKDKGWAWYENGKRAHKVNTFTDFIACGRYLVAEHYTSHDRIVAEGGSAGGMLMGAIANMAPADYCAIVAHVPFVDVLDTMLDASLPLTPPEWPEWGNPIESSADYETIAAYSPYDNVSDHSYPAIFALGGLTDPRVTYWEPAKWVAKLREHNTSKNPILLKINLEAGHGGAAGRFSRLDEIALCYAFTLKATGHDKACVRKKT